MQHAAPLATSLPYAMAHLQLRRLNGLRASSPIWLTAPDRVLSCPPTKLGSERELASARQAPLSCHCHPATPLALGKCTAETSIFALD
jgi:hypothetical protein